MKKIVTTMTTLALASCLFMLEAQTLPIPMPILTPIPMPILTPIPMPIPEPGDNDGDGDGEITTNSTTIPSIPIVRN